MDWILSYGTWFLRHITPEGILAGLIAGSIMTWIARGEWDRSADEQEGKEL